MKVGKVYVGNKRVRPTEATINFGKAWDFLNNPQAINDFPYVHNSGTISDSNPAYVGREITTTGLNSNCIELTQLRLYGTGTVADRNWVIGISDVDNYTGVMSDLFGLYVSQTHVNFYAFGATLYTGTRPQYTDDYRIKYNWSTGEWGVYFIHNTTNNTEQFQEEVLISYGIDTTYKLSIANRLQGKINLYLGSNSSDTIVGDQTAIAILSNES